MRFYKIVFALLAPLALAGCPDPRPALFVRGASAEWRPDGRVRVSCVVGNGGYDEFEGTMCVTGRWLRGAKYQYSLKTGTNDAGEGLGGEIVDETTACVKRDLDADQEAFFELASTVPFDYDDDLLIEITITQDADVEALPPWGPEIISMPPPPAG